MTLEGFDESAFSHEGTTRQVFRRGAGPGVVIVHEIPGITPAVARFARRVAERGFTVFLPSLLGTPGRPFSGPYVASSLARACVSREFAVLAANESSPITDFLRALCRAVHAELGGRGVGALGMCLTGNFALAMMVDPSVAAPVLSQPSLPFPVGRERKRGLHVSPGELATIKRRVADEGLCVLGLRFTADPAVPPERFRRLRDELGAGFEGIEIDSGPGNAHGIHRGSHSVLTEHLLDREGHPTHDALERVLAFFEERLK
jgi:dienelactone hydrolase